MLIYRHNILRVAETTYKERKEWKERKQHRRHRCHHILQPARRCIAEPFQTQPSLSQLTRFPLRYVCVCVIFFSLSLFLSFSLSLFRFSFFLFLVFVFIFPIFLHLFGFFSYILSSFYVVFSLPFILLSSLLSWRDVTFPADSFFSKLP